MTKTKLILIAGPYRSGTGDDPAKIAANLQRLEAAALAVWQKGHVPVIGEWLALPLMKQAGSRQIGDALYQAYGYPVADRLLEHCDGVLRLEGASKGADGDVALAKYLGLPVYRSPEDLPAALPQVSREDVQ